VSKLIQILYCVTLVFLVSKELNAQKHTFSRAKMGSELIITVDAIDTIGLSECIWKSYALADSLITIFSDYDPNSELSQINASLPNTPILVSCEISKLIQKSRKAYQLSNGAFDITIGKLSKEWRKAKQSGIRSNPDTITWYQKHIGIDQYSLDTKENILIKKNAYFHFDLGGIAKGYIAHCISHFLYKSGWNRHLINAGGDMVVGDAPIGKCGWLIALKFPLSSQFRYRLLCLKNQAVATSGSTYQHFVNNDTIYSHIIHPKSGQGISSYQNVTVITDTGADADWLATACSILSWEHSKKLIHQMPNTTLIISSTKVTKKGFKVTGKKLKLIKLE
jgi:FAD:protein FMN transferase